MTQLPKLSITEKRVLLLMLEQWRRDSNVVTFVWLAERIGASRASVKRACRRLANLNLTEHAPFWTDDGMLGGTGYTLTCQGMVDVRFHEKALQTAVVEYDAATKPLHKCNTIIPPDRNPNHTPTLPNPQYPASHQPGTSSDHQNPSVDKRGGAAASVSTSAPGADATALKPPRKRNTLHDGTYEGFGRPYPSWWRRLLGLA